ncbi:uncharacterized protein F4822DRAFT_15835 [Hypoxylon trugodes]|uniref:uncharacterized protein n=1 Tax=Hypoxylon trugodes TaxID=326681 RepID=UPI00219A46BE|nr:uncharacterized protein F4822DRAFT_15835 [Hypoxylon trugodes]KAI1393531.1 hypothetical protein F4822DRAFT_15835 [Hypoxylon trugodes]
MSTQESSYAPKSPDLSSFYSGASSDIPQNPNTPGGYPFQAGFGVGVGPTSAPGTSLRYNNQPQPHHHQYSTYQQQPAPPAQAQPTSAPTYSNNTAFNPYPNSQGGGRQPQHQQHNHQQQQQQSPGQYYSPRQQTQTLLAQTNTSSPYSLQQTPTATAPAAVPFYSSFSESAAPYHQLQAQPSQLPTSQPNLQSTPQSTSQSSVAHDQFQSPDSPSTMPPRKIAPAAKQAEVEPSPVRTKFPTARIKRIMQADEEVGKVAQQTPIAVGKALELFMVQLVRKSAEVAKEKNSKRITAQMLKQAIGSANEWDFLAEIVSKVGEEKEGGKSTGRVKPESDSDEEVDGGEVKKKGRGGRKKKVPA